MEAATWNLRECSVRLWRCDLGGQESAPRVVKGVPPTASLSAEHVHGGGMASTANIKVEVDCEDAVVKQELDVDHPQLWRDIATEADLHATEGYITNLKMEHAWGQTIIKQELDIGPTVLQSKTTPSLGLLSAELMGAHGQGDLSHPWPSTSSGRGATAAPFGTLFARPVQRADLEHDCYQEESAVVSNTCFMLGLRESYNTHEGVLRAQSSDKSDGWDTSARIQKFARQQYERNCRKYSATKDLTVKCINTLVDRKLYKCVECQYSTSRLSNLKLHLRTHTGEKPYKCEVCEYSASELSKLKIHRRIHTGEKPYKCDLCEYSASQLSNFKRHTYTHKGEKRYQCEICEYRASQLGHLKLHMCTHTGEKRYKCELCEYSASESGTLKRHMRTHTGEKPYKCELCEYSASRLGHLKRHMRIHST